VRNSARVNAILWRVKHLVEIIPIKLPEQFEGSPDGCPTLRTQIQDDGEFKIPKDITTGEEIEQRALEKNDPRFKTRYNPTEMQWHLIMQWYRERNP
jgi:hypothetical protein